MQKPDIDTKNLFIIVVLATLFIFAYQAYLIFFTTQTSQQTQTSQEIKNPEPLPQLMLGTSREKVKPSNLTTYKSQHFELVLSEEGGRIVSFKDLKYNKDLITEEERKLNLYPLEVFTGDPQIDSVLSSERYQIKIEKNKITLSLNREDWSLVKVLEDKGTYFKVNIKTKNLPAVFVSAGTYVKEDEFYTHSGPVIKLGEKTLRLDIKDVKAKEFITGDIKFAGVESRYYYKGFSGNIPAVGIYKQDETTFLLVKAVEELNLYMGAKEYAKLKPLGLSDVIDYGSLKLIVKPLFIFMYWIYQNLHSWVFSILALTLLVRVLMFPLTYKSTLSMMKLSELAPKMQQLKEKYKNDPAKFQEEMMKLYSEVGFNPASGCLPILLQIPVFFALYKVLTITADLQLEGLLWIPSLAEKDPFYVLPILMGLTMIAQQFISPSPEKSQNLVMYISAVIFTFLFASFPSGLVLYWTFNNIISLAQSYVIKRLTTKPQTKHTKGKKK
ncbi:YidC/Oxa1 family insertase periplasmic-domain containing protein [Thermocrinis sp.]|uniref:YidC/Oxa1 family insertase periplasmic-domain containing protein n=1 Tax=Thermocrinis sp. TaxID=2024383 RepID=UPI002FDE78E3